MSETVAEAQAHLDELRARNASEDEIAAAELDLEQAEKDAPPAEPLALPAPEKKSGKSLYLCNLTAQVQQLTVTLPPARPDAPGARSLVVVQPYASDLVADGLDDAAFDRHVAELKRFGGRTLDDLDPAVPPFGLVYGLEPIDLDQLIDSVATRNQGHAQVISANRHRYGGAEAAISVTNAPAPFEG